MRRLTNGLLWFALALLAVDLFAQTPTPVPYVVHKGPMTSAVPGYWLNTGYNSPCPQTAPGIHPFTTWQEPVLGTTLYYGGDMNVVATHPNNYGTYIDAIYGNHSRAYYDFQGFIIPMIPQLGPPNFYPAPTAASQLCTQWVQLGNTSTCPNTGNYSGQFANNSVWTTGLAFYQPQIQAACSGPQPTRTPTPSPTFVPTKTNTPGPSPTPAPNQFQDWIYQVAKEKLIVGCSPTLYCPGDNTLTWQGLVTRAQQAVYMLKAEHGSSYTPPPCTPPGNFTDVPCVH